MLYGTRRSILPRTPVPRGTGTRAAYLGGLGEAEGDQAGVCDGPGVVPD